IGQTEHEIAGELAHRMLKHGISPAIVSVSADGRICRHRRAGVTSARVERSGVLYATGQRDGLHLTAARSVHFGEPPNAERADHASAAKIVATLAIHTRPKSALSDVLEAGRAAAQTLECEPDWFRGPTGHVTGWLPVERPITPAVAYH